MRLKQVLDYNPETGAFIRRKNGKAAGSLHWPRGKTGNGERQNNKYRLISIDAKNCQAHNLAWFWMTEEWPKRQVDHIDFDGTNNTWSNLRLANPAHQMAHRRGKNRDLPKGVDWMTGNRRRPYRARLNYNGGIYQIGCFETAQAAHDAYCRKGRELAGEFFSP